MVVSEEYKQFEGKNLLVEREHHHDTAGYLFSFLRILHYEKGEFSEDKSFKPEMFEQMGNGGYELTQKQIDYLKSLENLVTAERSNLWAFLFDLSDDEKEIYQAGLGQETLSRLQEKGIEVKVLSYPHH